MATTEAERIVDRFVAAWERRDVDELLDYFTEDAVWHPIPMKPAVGKPAIRELLSVWLRWLSRVEVHRQVSDGKIVMQEQTNLSTVGAREIVTPTAGVFEIDNGRITAWREYFDMPPSVDP